MRRFLSGNSKTALRDSYIWNTIGGALDAGQSALLLIVISRTNPAEDAGMFSIAYAIACLAVTVGKWGMRNFEATDVQEKYNYSVYVSSRIITCGLMLLLAFFYILKGMFTSDYTLEKCMIILLMCLLKMVDSAEDVVHGMFQRKGRLDIGAKSMATRYIVVLVTCMFSLCLTHNLVLSLGVSLGISLAYMILTISLVYDNFQEKLSVSVTDRRVWRLLAECFSLFAGSFLMIYIANAPKYAIDEYMTENVQACFNYIFMPVYVISVLNMFIYQPVLTKLAIHYQEGKRKEFLCLFSRQLAVILCLTVVLFIGGTMFGIPVLSFLYNTDLAGYKLPFQILFLGGCFLAVSGYLGVVVTIMRKQNWLMLGYGLAGVIALMVTRFFVYHWKVMGAALLYTGIVLIQVVIFSGIFVICFLKRDKKKLS